MDADPIVGGVTAVVTGATMDPFIGMIAGLLVKGLMIALSGSCCYSKVSELSDKDNPRKKISIVTFS